LKKVYYKILELFIFKVFSLIKKIYKIINRDKIIMKYLKTFLLVVSLIVLFYIIAPNRIYAYLDAGTGSYIIQIIIAVAIGGAFGIKIFWRKIYGFFKSLSLKAKKNDKIKKK